MFDCCRGVLNNFDGQRNGSEEGQETESSSSSSSSSAEMGSPSASESSTTGANACDSEADRTQNEEDLPPGWERHEGEALIAQVMLRRF